MVTQPRKEVMKHRGRLVWVKRKVLHSKQQEKSKIIRRRRTRTWEPKLMNELSQNCIGVIGPPLASLSSSLVGGPLRGVVA